MHTRPLTRRPQRYVNKVMIILQRPIEAWGTPDFNQVLKQEIESLPGDQLPLQQGLSISSYALTENFSANILGSSEDQDFLHIKAGIFYSGIVAGCSCADDPTPVDEQTEYCEILLDISKTDGSSSITLVDQD